MGFKPSDEKIRDIIKRRLLAVDPDLKKNFPRIFAEPTVQWLSLGDDILFGLIFIDEINKQRINKFKQRNLHPFPGLMTSDSTVPAAFRIEKSRNNVFSGCTVKNSFSFSIGQDSTIVITDHLQVLTGTEVGDIEYKVPLAYVVSFGDEITDENAYEYLEELIAYSIKIWRPSNG